MPRGKYMNHKGRSRRFTNPEELEEQRRKEEQEKKWRKNRGDESSESEEEESGPSKNKRSSASESETDSSSEEEHGKAKGVSNLIEIENPNRVQKKSKKLSSLNASLPTAKPELSRREREEIAKQRAELHYQKLHAEGKTEQARADLARLAIIKQQREEAQKRREQEKHEREEAAKQRTDQTKKALGKKT